MSIISLSGRSRWYRVGTVHPGRQGEPTAGTARRLDGLDGFEDVAGERGVRTVWSAAKGGDKVSDAGSALELVR